MAEQWQYPFRDPDLPLETRVNDLIGRLTTEEKINLMAQYQDAVPRLGIAPYKHGTEAAHGIAWLGPATTFPQPIGLACTWDADLLRRVGSVIGDEARVWYRRNPAVNGLTLWAPTVDLERDPRWGRTEEAYGEDPFLVGKLASALIRGIQGDHPFYLKAVATLKHFLGNNNEAGRGDKSVSIDPRNMREYYLKVFETAFKEGGALSMMTAYNAVNGVPANLLPMITSVVKQEWGMNGFVVSDAFDVTGTVRDHGYMASLPAAVAASIRAGIDSITDDAKVVKQAIREALEMGLLTENDLDVALRNTFRVRFRLGEFDPDDRNPYAEIGESHMMRPEHEALSLEAARKSIVLLKNDGVLPLSADRIRKIAVIGPLADVVYRDWYSGTLPYAVTPLAGIVEALAGRVQPHGPAGAVDAGDRVIHAKGATRVRLKSSTTGRYVRIAEGEDAPLVADAERAEDADVFELNDWGWDSATLTAVRNGKFLTTDDRRVLASADDIWGWFTKEVFQLDRSDEDCVRVRTWNGQPVRVGPDGMLLAGTGDAGETANVVNVAGAAEVQGVSGSAECERFAVEIAADGLREAAEAARQADAAVVFVGNHPLINGKETVDRPDIALPEPQERLIREVLAVNPNTIVVVIGSYPFALGWTAEHAPAILYLAHAGQELGRAVAGTLFGRFNPAGRLNMTWYRSADQLPDFMDYDIIQGKRTYLYFDGEPLYPFGYGLSYSRFEYADLTISADAIGYGERVKIGFTVTNVSDVYGEEVPQLYIRCEDSRVQRPLRQLAGFARIGLAPGESKRVTFELSSDDLRFWDITRSCWCLERGVCRIMVGASSADIRLAGSLNVNGEVVPPRDLRQVTRAVDCDGYAGIFIDECSEGGDSAAVSDGGWIRFDDVAVPPGVTFIELRAWSADGAEAEIRIDGPDGAVAGSCPVPPGGRQEWKTCRGALALPEDRRSLWIRLSGAAHLQWLRIG
ncbi:MAG: beta-glucosidase [Thermobacillus sp.]|uniref:glycoside hydrolase family 3 protein n=1 Tax=Thermobacillus sp. TaxID=2108467 RepID=UPI000E377733|nr:glycoside hydrolase family 3 protein [Thermobacillus sp.]REK54545.1 MAG: beta-glucosidase [Thermobacillus sp.]